jgi:hypothetical protein
MVSRHETHTIVCDGGGWEEDLFRITTTMGHDSITRAQFPGHKFE